MKVHARIPQRETSPQSGKSRGIIYMLIMPNLSYPECQRVWREKQVTYILLGTPMNFSPFHITVYGHSIATIVGAGVSHLEITIFLGC